METQKENEVVISYLPFNFKTVSYRLCIYIYSSLQAHTICSPNVNTMLGQRRKQWANIELTLDKRFVFAGYLHTNWFG